METDTLFEWEVPEVSLIIRLCKDFLKMPDQLYDFTLCLLTYERTSLFKTVFIPRYESCSDSTPSNESRVLNTATKKKIRTSLKASENKSFYLVVIYIVIWRFLATI